VPQSYRYLSLDEAVAGGEKQEDTFFSNFRAKTEIVFSI